MLSVSCGTFTGLLIPAAGAHPVIGYPCFRFRVVGHYFALLTLALSAIVLQVVTATRDFTGGSLGYTPERYHGGSSIYAVQLLARRRGT
jgi:branched-chain amino acid transport system permease protein